MKKIFFLLILCPLFPALAQQSPHGDFAIECLDCHSTSSWDMRSDAKFDHASTGFTLAGQHRFLECRSCHADLRFAGTQRECLSCHTDIHNGELGSNCLRCHTMISWTVDDMLQKHQQTRFPLVGRHLDALCENCHENEASRRYASTSVECISCHRDEYTAAVSPDHVGSGFPVDCAGCHIMTAPVWTGSFDHQLTAFPLTGAHKALVCSECHADNRFTKLPTDCYSCHAVDYNGTTAPAHASGGFSHDCLSCHTTVAWSPANYDHLNTAFPLTGAHTATPCQDCHIGGDYTLVYSNCYQCHEEDYAAATNPDHVISMFGQDCTPCHTTQAWTPSTFDHDQYFRIYSGRHQGRWTDCATCHETPGVFTHFTCFSCHEHNRTETDSHHSGVGDYIYESAACYSCHKGV